MEGKTGDRPVTNVNGGNPVIRLAVSRSMVKAEVTWSLQKVSGLFVSPRRIHSLIVRITRST